MAKPLSNKSFLEQAVGLSVKWHPYRKEGMSWLAQSAQSSLYKMAKTVQSQRFRPALLMSKYTNRENSPGFPGEQSAGLGEGKSREEEETGGTKRKLKKQAIYRNYCG